MHLVPVVRDGRRVEGARERSDILLVMQGWCSYASVTLNVLLGVSLVFLVSVVRDAELKVQEKGHIVFVILGYYGLSSVYLP